MEDKRIVLRRPKKKLKFPTGKTSVPVNVNKTITLDDIDRMFDDIHTSPDNSLLFTPIPQQKSDAVVKHCERTSPVLDVTPAPKVFIEDLLKVQQSTPDISADFTEDKPIQTSSPKEKESVQQKNASNTEERLEPDLDTDQLNNSNTSQGSEEEAQVSIIVEKDQTLREQTTTEQVSPLTQEPEVDSQEEQSKSVYNVSVAASVFQQKLRGARECKPMMTHIKAPPPPPISDLEDDFLILEDETPFSFTIPFNAAAFHKQKLNKGSSTENVNSAIKGTKAQPQATPQKEKMTKRPGRKKKTKVATSDTVTELSRHDHTDAPAGDAEKNEEPIKTKKNKQDPVSDKPEEQHKDIASRDTDKEITSYRGKKKKMLSKGSKSTSMEFEPHVKISRFKSSKEAKKVSPESEGESENESEEVVKEQAVELDVHDAADEDVSTANLDPLSKSPVNSEESPTLWKRKRTQCRPCSVSDSEKTEGIHTTDNTHTPKKARLHSKESNVTGRSPVPENIKSKNRYQNQTGLSPKHRRVKEKGEKKKNVKNKPAKNNQKNKKKVKEQQEFPDLDSDCGESTPLSFAHNNISFVSGDNTSPRVPPYAAAGKSSSRAATVTPKKHAEELEPVVPGKRRRRPPGMWWTVNSASAELETDSSQKQLDKHWTKSPKPFKKAPRKQKKNKQKPQTLSGPQISTPVRLPPPEGAHMSVLTEETAIGHKSIRSSMARFKDIFKSMPETSGVGSRREVDQNDSPVIGSPSQIEKEIQSTDAAELRSTPVSPILHENPQDNSCQLGDKSKAFRSGPSSFILTHSFEKNDHTASCSEPVALSVSDICASPLKPLTLQPPDRDTLTKWFKNLWSSTIKAGVEITADDFNWFFYKGKVMGLQEDINSGSICNGKILLGSYMKKPLWVDHSATTVFNVLTSSVTVTVDGNKFQVTAGHSFIVHCGCAHSFQNDNTQPAVLYFTRILTESPD